jgi:hypothetical protein
VKIEDLTIASGLELLFRHEEQHPTIRLLIELATEVVRERRSAARRGRASRRSTGRLD